MYLSNISPKRNGIHKSYHYSYKIQNYFPDFNKNLGYVGNNTPAQCFSMLGVGGKVISFSPVTSTKF